MCKNCSKRSIRCNYEVRYHWISQNEHFQGRAESNLFDDIDDDQLLRQFALPSVSSIDPAPRKRQSHHGPMSRKRKIGQSVVQSGCFRPSLLRRLATVMEQVPFTADDEPITSLDGPGSLSQFRKFVIRKKGETRPADSNEKGADTLKMLPSPLLRPFLVNSHHSASSSSSLRSYPGSTRSSELYAEGSNYSHPRLQNTHTSSLRGMTPQDFFDHFVQTTADTLVPIPYKENPFLSLLPRMALSHSTVWDLLAAYGAAHKYMLLHGLGSSPADEAVVDSMLAKSSNHLRMLRMHQEDDEIALLLATVLAMIEIDRGRYQAWRFYMKTALNIIRTRQTFSEWQLDAELNSMTFRMVGYMCGVSGLTLIYDEVLEFPSWPQWSGNLDFLTGIDLNLLPMFNEASALILEVKQNSRSWTMAQRASVNFRALRIMQRMNDYWLEEYWPDSEITAMCIVFQEALQIHVLRRVLQFSMYHPRVQRLVALAMRHVERFIPPASTIQRCMSFTLLTIASEALNPEFRTSLLIRLRHMGEAGFAYNLRIIDIIRGHWKNSTSLIESPGVIFA